MYACLHTPDFSVQAALRMRQEIRQAPVVILDGEAPLETVIGTNAYARKIGIALGMRRLQAESFDHVHIFKRCLAQEDAAQNALLACAESFSPRVEPIFFEYAAEPGGTLVLDISGTETLLGSPEILAKKLRKQSAEIGLRTQIAVSKNFYAAICAARGFPGITVIPSGKEAEVLGTLPLKFLDLSPEFADTFELWGIRTFAALATLPERELIARIGQQGQRLRAIVRGEQAHLLVPIEPSFASQLHETIELDYPVELIEPLLFLFHRMVDQLLVRVQSRALAIASITIRLTLDSADSGTHATHQRTIRPALPVQNAQTLLKLIQLDLEMYPPVAAITAIHMQAEPAKPQIAQNGLFLPQGPAAERLEILLARLRKLVGEDRVGSPQLIDTYKPDSFRINAFTPRAGQSPEISRQTSPVALRVCRPPQAIGVLVKAGKFIQINLDSGRYNVLQQAGPWRASGQWWSNERWCREEWDLTISNNNEIMICRIAHDPGSQCWYMAGIYD
jgi:protein ImuB